LLVTVLSRRMETILLLEHVHSDVPRIKVRSVWHYYLS
jgi:hypothetical protein